MHPRARANPPMNATMRHPLVAATMTLLLTPLAALNSAELKVAAVFSDHMVLQRDKTVPIWGWADPGEKITAEFAGQKKTAIAGPDGKWIAKLDALEASAEPRDLLIAAADHPAPVVIRDVLVGEVWIGSGQSNMAMAVRQARDFEQEQAAASLPLVRLFHEESPGAATPQADGSGKWTVCTPDTIATWSATLYFFGRELHRSLSVPVGLINSSVGGTPIEQWISAEAQQNTPELQKSIAEDARVAAAFDPAKAAADFEIAVERWKKKVAEAKAAGKPLPRKPVDPVTLHERKTGRGTLFNGKIAPLVPYAIRGVVWYQGEANSHPGKGALYQYQLPALVNDWRARWGERLPFAWVQLPNFRRDGEDWMLVREAMLKSLRLPTTGMAITIDIGEANNIHPKNKQEVGRRLSLWALGEVYGKKVADTSGPLPAGHETRGAEMVVSLTHAGGLQAKDGALRGFVIAGEDKQWKPAQARIEGDQVVVSSPEVEKPVAVRYAWADNPDCNLQNGADLPASPFRTDDWPVPSESPSK